jgi:HlyD family secretion protein
MSKPEIFRKVALDRLSSPEQLDQLMQVTTSRGWMALATVGALLATAIGWSIMGSIPERIAGRGILLQSGGVFEVVSQSGGRVADLPIRVGDMITEGQVIARLAQPQLTEQIQQARTRVAELEAQYEEMRGFTERDAELQAVSLAERRANLNKSIETAEVSLAALGEKIEVQEQLVRQGLITRQTLLGTVQEHARVKEAVRTHQNQLTELRVQGLQAQNRSQQELQTRRSQLLEAKRELANLESDLNRQAQVTTAYSGRVLEVMAEQGGMVERGSPILTVSLTGKAVRNLEAVVYVPSTHGKKVKRGMEIQIAPSTVKKEEFGYLLARVTYVSDFPATQQGMQRVLKNSQLVSALSGSDAPYEIHADLIPDVGNPSQYRWSSSEGPPLRIQSGTLATANIVVERRRPIFMVLPQLRLAGSDEGESEVSRVGLNEGRTQ